MPDRNGAPVTAAEVDAAIAVQDWERAQIKLRRLLAMHQHRADLWMQLSYVESYRGRYRAAREAALTAAGLPPASLEVATDTLARLRTFNEIRALGAYLDRLGPITRLPIPLLLAAASRFSSLNDQSRALLLLDEARRGDPDYPATLIARAQVLMYMGRFDEAGSELLRAMARAPHAAQLYWLLSQVSRATPESNRIDRIRALLSTPKSPADAAMLGFALHKELDDLGDIEAAWSALEQACRVKRSMLHYDAAANRALFDALIANTWRPAPQASGGVTPVFIVGMHRSGTTLLEQLLDAHPQVQGLGELYDFTSAMRYATDYHCKGVIDSIIIERAAQVDPVEVGRRYLDGIAWRLQGTTHFTDKLPSNFLNIGFICWTLPEAKILHMVRDPVETCFSNLRELFSEANPYSYDQLELADYFLQYRRLMRHWHEQYPGRILDVSYARLTAEPDRVMREVASFCGLDYMDGMSSTASSSRAVATASAVQVRYRIQARERPKWEPYANELKPLIDMLGTASAKAAC